MKERIHAQKVAEKRTSDVPTLEQPYDDGASLEQPDLTQPIPRTQDGPTPRGTTSCPICGSDTPHAHDREQVEWWATGQVARWGYAARLSAMPPTTNDDPTMGRLVVIQSDKMSDAHYRNRIGVVWCWYKDLDKVQVWFSGESTPSWFDRKGVRVLPADVFGVTDPRSDKAMNTWPEMPAWATEGDDDTRLPPATEREIYEAFPTRSERHDLYAQAMHLVGARRSKGGLVELVNWLLHRIELATSL